MAVESIHIQLLGALRLLTRPGVERLLDVLDGDVRWRPTHWAPVRDLRDPYDRRELITWLDACIRGGRDGETPVVRRGTHPRYVATWAGTNRVPAWLAVETPYRPAPDDPAVLFELASVLAGRLAAEFGVVDVRFEGQPRETRLHALAHGQHVPSYVDFGLGTLFARTYCGPRLVELMGGPEVLRESGGVVAQLEGGVYQLDLVEAPWTAEPKLLKARQAEITERLQATGVFQTRTGEWRPVRGARWEPPPGARS